MSTHKAHTLNITYKQHYAQVVDKFGDTWTRTKNSNGNWVWALGDYEEDAPIYGAQQTGTLPASLEPYRAVLPTRKEQDMFPCCTNHKATMDESPIEAIEEMVENGFVKRIKTTRKTDLGSGTSFDPINPDYYKFPSGAEVVDIAEHLSSNGGQSVQYIARSTRLDGRNKGDSVENLEKAIWFLNREIKRLKQEKQRERTNG